MGMIGEIQSLLVDSMIHKNIPYTISHYSDLKFFYVITCSQIKSTLLPVIMILYTLLSIKLYSLICFYLLAYFQTSIPFHQTIY